MSRSAVPISPLHPCSTPRFERRSASIEGSMPATSASRAAVNVSSASSLRPARCNSPASWLMARIRSSPVSSSTARRPKASDWSNWPEYDSEAASDIEHWPSSSASPSSTARSTAARRNSTDSSTRRSSRHAVPSTRSSPTRSPSAADGNRDLADSMAPAGSVYARLSRSAVSSIQAVADVSRCRSPQAVSTSPGFVPPATTALTRGVAKLVPLQLAAPVLLG